MAYASQKELLEHGEASPADDDEIDPLFFRVLYDPPRRVAFQDRRVYGKGLPFEAFFRFLEAPLALFEDDFAIVGARHRGKGLHFRKDAFFEAVEADDVYDVEFRAGSHTGNACGGFERALGVFGSVVGDEDALKHGGSLPRKFAFRHLRCTVGKRRLYGYCTIPKCSHSSVFPEPLSEGVRNVDGESPSSPEFPNDPRMDGASTFAERRRRFARSLCDEGIAFALVTRPLHIGYLTGVFLEPHERLAGLIVFPGGEFLLVVPAVEDVPEDLPVIRYRDGEDPYRAVGTYVRQVLPSRGAEGGLKIGVEKEHLTLARAAGLTAAFTQEGLVPHRLVSVDGILRDMRAVKDPKELAALARAARDTDALLETWLRELRMGMSEREAVRLLERLRDEAGYGPFAFAPIVLVGERTALPHGVPGDALLRPWSLLLVDLGVTCCGYAGDLTRTYVLTGTAPAFRVERKTWERLYRAVEEAQAAALAAVVVGLPYAEVDRAARDVLERYGLAKYFVHRTGHGLGLEIHEAPQVSTDSRDRVTPGHVFTVEPGVYVPGVGGVRIEDVVALAEGGAEVLTRSPKAWDAVLLSLPPSMA